jgi:iron complex outermembrane receptor protein
MNLIAPSNLVEGRQAPSLHGDYSRDGAFATLLEGSGLKFRIERDAVVIGVEVDRDAARAGREHEAVESNRILVTGTRIRGAPVASTVIKLSQEPGDAGRRHPVDPAEFWRWSKPGDRQQRAGFKRGQCGERGLG